MRTLHDVLAAIDAASRELKSLRLRQSAGERIIPKILELQVQMESLYAEKRWLMAGGIRIGGAKHVEQRLNRSLNRREYANRMRSELGRDCR